MRLTLAFVLLGAAGLLIYTGFSDPPGGITGVVRDTFTGKKTAPTTTPATPTVGQIAQAIYTGGAAPGGTVTPAGPQPAPNGPQNAPGWQI